MVVCHSFSRKQKKRLNTTEKINLGVGTLEFLQSAQCAHVDKRRRVLTA